MKINKRSKKQNEKKEKEKYASKEKEKAKEIKKKNCLVASVFSRGCESYIM